MPKPLFQATAEGLPTRRAVILGLAAVAAIAAVPVATAAVTPSLDRELATFYSKLLGLIERAPPGFVGVLDIDQGLFYYANEKRLDREGERAALEYRAIVLPRERAPALRAMLAEHGVFPPITSRRAAA